MTIPPLPCPSTSADADWLTASAPAIGQMGWHDLVRMERPGDGISIATLDVVPPHDVRMEVEGPPTFSISLFLDGEGLLTINGGEPLEVFPGLAVLCATDQNVSGVDILRGGRRLRIVDVRFEPHLLTALGGPMWEHYGGGLLVDRSVPERGAVLMGFPAPETLLLPARQILSCPYVQADIRQLYLRAKALEMLAGMIFAFRQAAGGEEDASGESAAPEGRGGREQRRILEAQRLLETRLDENWTIARLARAVSLNEKSLKSGFRAHVGQSIHAYLVRVRIEAAASMLVQGHSVTEVALATGFSNLSHFSKTFRVATGLAPRDYARQR